MSNQLLILGWSSKVLLDSLRMFKVNFQVGYEYELLKEYVLRGEYLSKIPFGICKQSESIYLLCEKKPSFLSISTNPITQAQEAHIRPCREAISTYTITSLYDKLSSEGYERPVDVQSFLGKSKGMARLSNKPIECVETKFIDSPLKFCLNQAEKFSSVSIDTESCLVFYSPRHEISESSFELSAGHLFPDELKDSKHAKRTPRSVMNRFYSVSSILSTKPKKRIHLKQLDPFPINRFKRPTLVFPGENNALLGFEQSFKSIILSNVVIDQQFETQIIVDTTGDSKQIEQYANAFREQFSAVSKIDADIQILKNLEQLENISAETIIFIMDDFNPGMDFVYRTIKTTLKIPSKIVKLSTLMQNNTEEIALITYLSLRVRLNQILYQNVKNNPIASSIGLSLIGISKGDFLILSGVVLEGLELRGLCNLLENDRERGTPTEDEIIDFIQTLTGRRRLPNSTIVMTSDSVTLLNRLLSIKDTEQFPLAFVSDIDAVILEGSKSSFNIPLDGSFVKLSDDQSLIVTNGRPEKDEIGVPLPAYVKVFSTGCYTNEEIFRGIYYQTFIHPASPEKTKLPLVIHASKKKLALPKEILFQNWTDEGVYL